jgi:catechol 2,3-dioxygenase-like lactoylglutathione lyase family enzyme
MTIELHPIRPDSATVTKFHISLHVSDLARSVAFYRVLFDLEPAKQYGDYAKFELEDPPVVLSLTPQPAGPAGGVLSHAGLKVPHHETIERTRVRLLAAGYEVECQQGAVCGYRRQDKLHAADPDGTRWEVYVVEEELSPEKVQRSVEGPAARVIAAEGPVVWEHFITSPLPERIEHLEASVDEVRLVGTFNANLMDTQQQLIVREARRVLKPAGKLLVHGLMADRPFPGKQPELPGLAALVSHVPVQSLPLELLKAAGFVGLHIARYSDKPWFRHEGVELREVKIVAWQPVASASYRRVLYKGPFAEAVDDIGTVYPRGVRMEVSDSTWEMLRRSPAAEQFLFLDLKADAAACSA